MIPKCFIITTCFLTIVSSQCPPDQLKKISTGKGTLSPPFYYSKYKRSCEWKFNLLTHSGQYLVLINITINNSSQENKQGSCKAHLCFKNLVNEFCEQLLHQCNLHTVYSTRTCRKKDRRRKQSQSCEKKGKILNTFSVKLNDSGTFDYRTNNYRYQNCFMMQYEYVNCKKGTATKPKTTNPSQKASSQAVPSSTTSSQVATSTSTTTTHSTTSTSTTTQAVPSSTTSAQIASSTSATTTQSTTSSSSTKSSPSTLTTTTKRSETKTTLTVPRSTSADGICNTTTNASIVTDTLPQIYSNTPIIILAVIIPLVVIGISVIAVWFCRKRKQAKNSRIDEHAITQMSTEDQQAVTVYSDAYFSFEPAHISSATYCTAADINQSSPNNIKKDQTVEGLKEGPSKIQEPVYFSADDLDQSTSDNNTTDQSEQDVKEDPSKPKEALYSVVVDNNHSPPKNITTDQSGKGLTEDPNKIQETIYFAAAEINHSTQDDITADQSQQAVYSLVMKKCETPG